MTNCLLMKTFFFRMASLWSGIYGLITSGDICEEIIISLFTVYYKGKLKLNKIILGTQIQYL